MNYTQGNLDTVNYYGPNHYLLLSGVINSTCNYYNGDYHVYHFNGRLKMTLFYNECLLQEIKDCYDENGNSSSNCGSLKNGNGTIIRYSFKTNLIETFHVINGIEQELEKLKNDPKW